MSASTSWGKSSRSVKASSTLRCATSLALEPNQRCGRNQSRSASSGSGASGSLIARVLGELEPVEAARGEREQVGPLADAREPRAPEQLDGVAALVLREVELDGLRRAGEVVDAQHEVVLVAADVGEDAAVGRRQRLVGTE